ncbi:MAG TPA: serine hydrolase [Ruania sp.]|nr:serine hydrolase [Ruania sp.]
MTVVGGTREALDVAHTVAGRWTELGLRGGFLARHLTTGAELGFAVDDAFPLASVVKLPQALVLLDRISRGQLDGAMPVQIDPTRSTPGPTGIAQFRHPSTVAVSDLLYLAVAVSDNAASDALFDLLPEEDVTAQLSRWGHHDIIVRHRMVALYEAVARWSENDMRLALQTAAGATTAGGGHSLPVLDAVAGNVGTAAALVRLLADIWTDQVATPAATAQLRDLLGSRVTADRLGLELASDRIRVRSKTGTFLHSRHEAGVVEIGDGERIAVAALTESSVPAMVQPEVDRAIGRAARLAVECLRD